MMCRIRAWLLNEIVAAGLWIVLIGAAMNYTVITTNDGMPVRGQQRSRGIHIPMTDRTKLPALADWIHFKFLDLDRIISPGDICLFAGIGIGSFGIILGYGRWNWGPYQGRPSCR